MRDLEHSRGTLGERAMYPLRTRTWNCPLHLVLKGKYLEKSVVFGLEGDKFGLVCLRGYWSDSFTSNTRSTHPFVRVQSLQNPHDRRHTPHILLRLQLSPIKNDPISLAVLIRPYQRLHQGLVGVREDSHDEIGKVLRKVGPVRVSGTVLVRAREDETYSRNGDLLMALVSMRVLH
ncbi:hypothetical protein BDQ17DRAFT_644985 [Cyathus striatus]|nr:hypothetical protein BDQ17DRAFT_644985 [Cyathus striatus]